MITVFRRLSVFIFTQFMKESSIGSYFDHRGRADGFIDEVLSLNEFYRSHSIEFQVCRGIRGQVKSAIV